MTARVVTGAGTDAVLAVTCAVAAGVLVSWYTHPGVLTSNDSATYLSTAQHLVAGKGITAAQQPTNSEVPVATQLTDWGRVPLAAWPPGYPVFLAVVMKAGMTALEAARVLCVVGATTMAAVAFVGSRWILGLPRLVGVVLAAACVIAPTVPPAGVGPMAVWSYALSESVYLPLALATVFVGIVAIRRVSLGWVVGTAVLIGLLSLVRATGPAIGVALVWAMFVGRGPSSTSQRRWTASAAVIGLSGFVAMGGWQLTNRALYGPSGDVRSVALHDLHGVAEALTRTCAGWFGVPASAPLALASLVMVVGVVGPCTVALVGPVRRSLWDQTDALGTAAVALAAVLVMSVGVVLVTRAFLDASIFPDARLLTPAQPFAYLLVAVVGKEIVTRSRRLRSRPYGPTVPAVVLASIVLLPAAADLPAGRIHVARSATETKVYGRLGALSGQVLFVTNTPDRLWLDTGATSVVLPRTRFIMSDAANPHFETDVAEIARLARHRPVLVVVTPDVHGWPVESTRTLARAADLTRLGDCGPDVRIWGVPGSRAAALATRVCRR